MSDNNTKLEEFKPVESCKKKILEISEFSMAWPKMHNSFVPRDDSYLVENQIV